MADCPDDVPLASGSQLPLPEPATPLMTRNQAPAGPQGPAAHQRGQLDVALTSVR